MHIDKKCRILYNISMFKPRESAIQNIALISILCGLVGGLSLITSFLTISGPLISLFVPLVSIAAALYCRYRFYPVFITAAIGISLVAGLSNISNVIFFIIPAIFTGALYGFTARKGFIPALGILSASILLAAFEVLSLYIIKWTTGVDIIITVLDIFNYEMNSIIIMILPLIFLVFGLMQFTLSYIIIHRQITIFQSRLPIKRNVKRVFEIIVGIMTILIISLMFFIPSAAFAALGILIYSGSYLCYSLFKVNRMATIIALFTSIIVSIILFSCLFGVIPIHYAVHFFGIPAALLAVLNLMTPRIIKPKFYNEQPSIEEIQ